MWVFFVCLFFTMEEVHHRGQALRIHSHTQLLDHSLSFLTVDKDMISQLPTSAEDTSWVNGGKKSSGISKSLSKLL